MQTNYVNQFNNCLEWLCIDDKPNTVTHVQTNAFELRQLLTELGCYSHIERRVVVDRLYKQQNTALFVLIALCYAKADVVHCLAPVSSVTQMMIDWLLSPYEAANSC
ncbi:hypothetical protein [Pseudoalteromonas sp. S16_S37]|uniref:hypothetical protein n=1 Tax=Pseudoalteromonas sp. S16_S37 TaxID=2720228 RepID=UPI0016809173|nr:hypothetical protein [Pseudoalteromonas sp. S16_S37]MBD1584843.1 hypothetical protein [Pseudoalteromonas sp. S16_S37]